LPKLLIVEDDEAMSTALRDGFAYEGFEVCIAKDGSTGLKMATEESPDVIILDVMLPRMNGLDVCKQIRKDGNGIPILMLTARGQEIDKVLGLKLVADDYVTKPFGFLELMARVEAILRRRTGPRAALETYRFGEVEVDFHKGEARKKGKPLDLSPRELRLLEYFIRHRGEVVAREALLDAVWGYDTAPLTRTVDMHVAKLRKKIEDPRSEPKFLITVHRMGYKFTG